MLFRSWTHGEYLGLGPSAQSYVGGCRFGNIADLDAYTTRLRSGELPISERVILSDEEQQRDALIFGLRLLNGVPHSVAAGDHGRRELLAQLSAKGLIVNEGTQIRLTPLGRRFADSVAGELF